MSATRYPAFDGLRTLCFLVIIAWHALLPFSHRPRGLKADVTSETVDVVVWLVRGLALKEFFLLAGFLAFLSFARMGGRAYLRHRLPRLVIPSLVALIFYNALFLWQVSTMVGTTPERLARRMIAVGMGNEVFTPRHVWFLGDLIVMTVLAVCFYELAQRVLSGGQRAWVRRTWAASVRWPAGLLLLTAATTLGLVLHHSAYPSADLTQFAALPFYPLLSSFSYHAVFFLFGWMLAGQPELLVPLQRRGGSYLLLGLLLRGLHFAAVVAGPRPPGGFWAVHAIDALGAWCVVLGFLGLFSRTLVVDRPLWRYLADSAYWCYLAHFFFLEQLLLLFQGRAWPAPLQYLIVLGGTLVLLGLTYEFFVRYTVVGRVLHGARRRPPGGRAQAFSWASKRASSSATS